VVKCLKGSRQKVRRAQILRQADADGPGWTNYLIAEAYHCRTQTVEKIRQQFVQQGFEEKLHRKQPVTPPVAQLLDGEQEAQVTATSLGPPPNGYANWSLRLLARRVVKLGIIEHISRETVRQTLEPLSGWRNIYTRVSCTKVDCAEKVVTLLDSRYADCEQITLVSNNLNTHTKIAFYETLEPEHARELVHRIQFCHTPKHGN